MTKKEYKVLVEEYRNRKYELNEKIHKLEVELLDAKIKNDALIKAITSEDTKMFIYNGDTYEISELSFIETGGCVDTLNLELIKVNNIVSYNGGLVGAMQDAIKNATDSLKVALFGNEKK